MVADGRLDLDNVRFHSHHEWEQQVNWKVALENYLECYHCPVAHPGFSKMIDVDPDSYDLIPGERTSSQLGTVRTTALDGSSRVAYDPRGDVGRSQYHFIWPNTTINISPGPQNISIERWVPVDAKTTVEVTDYFFGADLDEDTIQEVIAFDTQVATEDVALVTAVQKGLDSRAVNQGRLMMESERLIAGFQRNVYDAVAEAL
jgi:choline monooxygenase